MLKPALNLVFVSDIFGLTPALVELADQLTPDHVEPLIIDPYSGSHLQFKTETDAYSRFIQTVGLEQYKTILSDEISDMSDPLFFIGFSVGATAAWMFSCENKIQGQAVCFYGSQIRYYPDSEPSMKTECIFPDHEPHFDVQELTQQLSRTQNVTCTSVPFSHGFMNPCSVNFDVQAYEKYIKILKQRIAEYIQG